MKRFVQQLAYAFVCLFLLTSCGNVSPSVSDGLPSLQLQALPEGSLIRQRVYIAQLNPHVIKIRENAERAGVQIRWQDARMDGDRVFVQMSHRFSIALNFTPGRKVSGKWQSKLTNVRLIYIEQSGKVIRASDLTKNEANIFTESSLRLANGQKAAHVDMGTVKGTSSLATMVTPSGLQRYSSLRSSETVNLEKINDLLRKADGLSKQLQVLSGTRAELVSTLQACGPDEYDEAKNLIGAINRIDNEIKNKKNELKSTLEDVEQRYRDLVRAESNSEAKANFTRGAAATAIVSCAATPATGISAFTCIGSVATTIGLATELRQAGREVKWAEQDYKDASNRANNLDRDIQDLESRRRSLQRDFCNLVSRCPSMGFGC